MGGQLLLLARIALRNLVKSRLNWVIGAILLVGTLLVVVGGSLLSSMDEGMRRSIVGSVAGHIQIYAARSKDSVALFGNFGAEADLSPMKGYAKVEKALLGLPHVKAVVPEGINGALITSGNTIDLTLSRLRKTAGEVQAHPEDKALRERYESLKAHVRQMVAVLQGDLAKARQIAVESAIDPHNVAALQKASSDAFWASFDKDPNDALEFLENRIAPQASDGDLLYIRYVGTDLDTFSKQFDRLEIVDGKPVPPGHRGFLFAKYFYESSLKLKSAYRLDQIAEALGNGRTIAEDPDLQRMVKENKTQIREILLQLDPISTRTAEARLRDELGVMDGDLATLLPKFFDMTDANFQARKKFFYDKLAPLLDLYRIRVGDTLTIKAFTKSGYVQSVNVPVYGTYRFKGLENSALAGGMCLMDLVSFRELYGYLTADKKAEIEQLKKEAGAQQIDRKDAEAELFGSGDTVTAEATPGVVDDGAELSGIAKAIQSRERLDRVYSKDEMDHGVVLNAAVMLDDAKQIGPTLKAINDLSAREHLGIKAVSWQQASGLVGQFVTFAKLMLYVAVLIVFIVALVVLNNAVMMATLQRVREIGTLRAIGANRAFVLAMVLVETLALALIFGGAGMGLGAFFVRLLGHKGIPAFNDVASFFFSGPRLFPTLALGDVVGALVLVVGVSAIATFYPALLATRVAPVTAMQTDD